MSSTTVSEKEANVSSWRIIKGMLPGMFGLIKVMMEHPLMTLKMLRELMVSRKRVVILKKNQTRLLPYEITPYRPEIAHSVSNQVYLRPTRCIECDAPEIIAMSHQLGAFQMSSWDYASNVFEFVKKEVYTSLAAPIRGAQGALKAGEGTCLDKTHIFIALCRAAGIPGRIRMSQEIFAQSLYNNFDLQPIAKEWYDQMGYFLAHAMAEVFIYGEWVPADFSTDYRVEAQLGLPIARLGDEPEGTWNWPVPGSLIRCETFPAFFVFLLKSTFKVSASMFVIWQDIMETTTFKEGEKVIAEAGGLEAYDRQARQTHKAAMPEVSRKLFNALQKTKMETSSAEPESDIKLVQKR
jgi:transglutaminase-like putative cysteine protease